MLRLRVLRPAADEVREAVRWYAEEDVRLGRRFAAEVDRIIEHARRFPASASWVETVEGLEIRRFLTTVFPYRVITTEWQDQLVVLAVAHQRREPGYWRPRLAFVRR